MRMTQSDVDAYEARRLLKKQPQTEFVAVEKEAGLHQQILDECRRKGWIALHGSMAQATARTAGEPDFIILAENRILMVECKTRTGKLTLEQVGMMAHAKKLGHEIHVVRSLGEFLAVTFSETKKEGV